jgi:alkylation response protein AidB-like acyl-CoA dehydrogenase
VTSDYAIPLTQEEEAFREEVRAFIADKLRPEWIGVSELWSRTDMTALAGWTREVVAKGWATSSWPVEFGGKRLTVMQRYILSTEFGRARAPLILHINLHMVGPLIARFGTDWQRDHFLPRILDSEDFWAQGYSEPDAGSDLASLRTTAVRDGDDYIVNGQKIWTTNAHNSTEIFALVRTDPKAEKKQAGLSILLIPVDSEGITVRPIRTIDEIHHTNEIFFSDVRVPVSRLLGEENKGWTYTKLMLSAERESVAEIQPTRTILDDVLAVAREAGLFEDPGFRRRLLDLEFEIDALEMLELRALDVSVQGTELGYEPSLLKIQGSKLRQDVLQLGREALGPLAELMPSPDRPQIAGGRGENILTDALIFRAASIYGGTNEIQKNIVSKILFSLDEGVI